MVLPRKGGSLVKGFLTSRTEMGPSRTCSEAGASHEVQEILSCGTTGVIVGI